LVVQVERRLPGVLAIVVNWNGEHVLEKTVNSLLKSHYPNLYVLIVDNASTDGSRDLIARLSSADGPGRVQGLLLESNLGWGAAVNKGLSAELLREFSFFLCMNNDVIVEPDAVSKLVEMMTLNPSLGILSPVILDDHGDETPTGGHLNKLGWWDREVKGLKERGGGLYEADVVIGAAMLVRREVFEKIGGFDPGFFLYREDIDFCLRAKKAGFKVGIATDAMITHLEGASTSKVEEAKFDARAVYLDSWTRFAFKNLGWTSLVRWMFTRTGRACWWRIIKRFPSLLGLRLKKDRKAPLG